MRVFITGATGFIGSFLVPELVKAGHPVVGLSRSQAGSEALTRSGAEVFRDPAVEADDHVASAEFPRAASEEAADTLIANGGRVDPDTTNRLAGVPLIVALHGGSHWKKNRELLLLSASDRAWVRAIAKDQRRQGSLERDHPSVVEKLWVLMAPPRH